MGRSLLYWSRCAGEGVRPPRHGGMAERTMATVLKTVVALGSPGVRIPLPPPYKSYSQGRCRSGRSGPPAKWLRGEQLLPGFESLPPRLRALVAQRIRASPCGGEGRAFESRRGCHDDREAPALAGASFYLGLRDAGTQSTGIDQCMASHGKILPGLRMRFGSNASRICLISAIWASSSASDRYLLRVAPIPCSPVIAPPNDSDSR